ncbi:MAG: helix-turn-helix transcriptional regulator [Candidatus Baldrarchaeia archaeon]
MIDKILRLPVVLSSTGYSRSTLYLYIKKGLWPKPIKVGTRSVAWLSSEVSKILRARISEKSDDEIRVIVKYLEVSRKTKGFDFKNI